MIVRSAKYKYVDKDDNVRVIYRKKTFQEQVLVFEQFFQLLYLIQTDATSGCQAIKRICSVFGILKNFNECGDNS